MDRCITYGCHFPWIFLLPSISRPGPVKPKKMAKISALLENDVIHRRAVNIKIFKVSEIMLVAVSEIPNPL
jgi:hypothetical protein